MAAILRSVTSASTETTDTQGGTGIPIDVPTGIQNGDVLFLCAHIASSTGTYATPGGWDVVEPQFASTNYASSKMACYSRVANDEPSSYTIKWGTTETGRGACIMAAFTGIDTVTPIQDKSHDHGSGPTSTEIFSSVTPTSGTLLIAFAGAYTADTSSFTWTADGAMHEEADVSSSCASKSNAGIQLATQTVSAGATGTRTATGSKSNLQPCGVMIALNPSAEGIVLKGIKHRSL
jgi:hypothetical protein